MPNDYLSDVHSQRMRAGGAFSIADASASGASSTSLHYLIEVLFRYRLRSILFFVIALSAVATALVFWPREYASEAKMLVRAGRGANVTLDPTVTKGPAATVSTERNAEINSALELISSRALLEKLVDKIGTEPPYKNEVERDKAIIKLAKKLTIWSPTESNIICVSCQAKSPERAQKTVATLVDLFLADYLRVQRTPGSYEFFEQQAETIKQQLKEETSELQKTKSQFELASIDGRRTVLEKQVGLIEQQINENESALVAAQSKIAALRGELKDVPDRLVKQFVEGLPVEAANSKRQQLYNLQKREQELMSKYAEGHPELMAVRQQIRDTKSMLDSDEPDRAQATSGVLLTELVSEKGLLAQREALAEQYQRIHGEMRTLNQQEVRIVELERNIRILDTKYQTYIENLEQNRIDRELAQYEISNINVVQPATLRLKPTSPNKALTLILGTLIAGLGAFSLPFLSDQLDTTVRSSTQMEQCLNVPVLLTMPRSSRRRLRLNT